MPERSKHLQTLSYTEISGDESYNISTEPFVEYYEHGKLMQ